MPDYPSPAAKRRRIVQNIVTALSLILSVVLIIVLATAEPDSSVYQRGFDSGHASGYVEGKNDEATPAYNRGYAAGKESGYINGRNKGYWEGKQYMQQYIDELQEELRDYRLAAREMVQPDPGAGQQRRREGGMDTAGHGRRAHAPHAQPAPPGGQDRDGVHRGGVRGG